MQGEQQGIRYRSRDGAIRAGKKKLNQSISDRHQGFSREGMVNSSVVSSCTNSIASSNVYTFIRHHTRSYLPGRYLTYLHERSRCSARGHTGHARHQGRVCARPASAAIDLLLIIIMIRSHFPLRTPTLSLLTIYSSSPAIHSLPSLPYTQPARRHATTTPSFSKMANIPTEIPSLKLNDGTSIPLVRQSFTLLLLISANRASSVMAVSTQSAWPSINNGRPYSICSWHSMV